MRRLLYLALKHFNCVCAQDELEAYPVSCIHRCDAILTEKQFPSLLLLVCQYGPRKKPDIHFFSCENVGVSATV